MSNWSLCCLFLLHFLCLTTGMSNFQSMEDQFADAYSLSFPLPFAVEPFGAPVSTYTTGYLRSEYTDTSAQPKIFVQAVVLVLGVCYKSDAYPDEYTKLTKIIVNKNTNEITLFFATYSDANCNNELTTSQDIQPFKTKVTTSNGVTLKVKWKYTSSLSAASRLIPDNSVGFTVRFYGADSACSGDAYKFLVATNRCSNYLDFFGHVTCDANDEKLFFTEYPFSSNLLCPGSGTQIKTQPFTCSNQGTSHEPSYQEADCIPPA